VLERHQPVDAALAHWDVESLYRAVDDRQPREGGAVGSSASSACEGRSAALAQRIDAGQGETGGTAIDGPRAQRLRALAGRTGGDLCAAPQDSAAEADEAEQARRWRERLLRSQAGGPEGSLLRMLVADLPSSRTPWEQVLRMRVARALSRQPALSWSRPTRAYLANQGRSGPHRRLPWEPGSVASRAVPRVALVLDASGSIDAALLARSGGR
jgi:hypothetical protein